MQLIKKSTDVAVTGGGPAGLACALALLRAGARSLLIAKAAAPQPGRTVALMQGSVELLRQLGAWEALAPDAEPLQAIRLVDGTGNLLRSPTVSFHAHELGLDEFGYNIENDKLQAALFAELEKSGAEILDAEISGAEFQDKRMLLRGNGLEVEARLTVAADGRNSLLREQAGFAMRRKSYPQMAVTALLSHAAPHRNVSTEFHTKHGPMTFVPMQGDTSSLVLVTSPADAKHLIEMDDASFCEEVRRRAQSLLGVFSLKSRRGAWPLELALPGRFAGRRVMLVGEAAHVLPPIGAQGLNLGLRDAWAAASCAAREIRKNADPGGEIPLLAYDRSRADDIRLRSLAVDNLNRSLLTPFLPAHLLRGFGLFIAQKSRFLRRQIMQSGLGEFDRASLPRLEIRKHAT